MPLRLQSVLKIGGVWTTGKSYSFHLIRLHEQRGMPTEAVAQLEKAAALSPEPDTMASLARAHAISGQKEKALKIHPARK